MIKAEIITAYNRYVFEIPTDCYGGTEESTAEAYEWLDQQIHPDGFIELPGRVIDVDPKDVKGVDVWQEEPNPLDRLAAMHPAPEIQGPPTEPWAFTRSVTFLGRKINLEALAYELNGQRFVMPTALEGRAPHNALNEASLQQLLAANFQDAVPVIPPPVTLTATECYAFLVDYAEAAAPELRVAGTVNARAAGKVFE